MCKSFSLWLSRGIICAVLAAVGLCSTPHLRADTIEMWTGEKVENAEILKIDDGYFFLEADGKRLKVKLSSVKSIEKPVVAPVTLLHLAEGEHGKRAGNILGLALTDPRARIHDPLIRVFVLVADENGARETQLYTNRRGQDPTMLVDAPFVDTESYASRYWFIPSETIVAWHIEVWVDGDRTFNYDRSKAEDKVPSDWWQASAVRRATTLQDTGRPKGAAKSAEEFVKTEEERLPMVAVSFTAATVRNGEDNKGVAFSCAYRLDSRQLEEPPLPQVVLYYLSEDERGRRAVRSVDLEPNMGKETKMQNYRLIRELEVAFPNTITHGLGAGSGTAGTVMDDKAGEELLYWRLEAIYKETAVAVREGGKKNVGDALPANWWK